MCHGSADILRHLQILLLGHPRIGSRQHCGSTPLQMVQRRRDRILPQLVAVAGVGVDIHQSGTYVGTFGIQDLTALGYRGGTHLSETGDLTVLDE